VRDTAAACVIVGGMLVLGPGVGIAAAHPDSGRHHRVDGRAADASGHRRVSIPTVLGEERPRSAPEHSWAGTQIGQNVRMGGGAELRAGVEFDDGVQVGGGVRIGRDIAMLQSANPNAAGQQGAGPTPAGRSPAAPMIVSAPNLPRAVQPRQGGPSALGAPPVAGAPPGAVPPLPASPMPLPAIPPMPAAPPMPATPPMPAAPPMPATPPMPAAPPIPAIPPPVPAPAFLPPPAYPPTAAPPSALPSGPSLSPAPAVQTPPPSRTAPLTSIAPQSPPGKLSYRAGYTEYLQRASTTEVAAVAVPGVTGMFLMTGCGVFAGFRRARTGHMIQVLRIARFTH